MSINKVTISGNITRDSELRYTKNQTPVLGFSVAVNESRKNPQTNEWENVPNYFDCSFFGKRAEKLSSLLIKGTKVVVSGKLHYSTWMAYGEKNSKVSIIAEDIEFFSRQNQNKEQSQAANEQPKNSQLQVDSTHPMNTQPTNTQPTYSIYEDEIKF